MNLSRFLAAIAKESASVSLHHAIVFSVIAEANEPIQQRDLHNHAALFGDNESTLSRSVRHLVSAGLIERNKRFDNLCWWLELSAKGKDLMNNLVA